MANQRFQAIMARSEELDRKMQDIRKCLGMMNGLLKMVCAKSMSKSSEVVLEIAEGRGVEVSHHGKDGIVTVSFSEIEEHSSFPIDLKANPIGNADIDLLWANLDKVVEACESFCAKVGVGMEFARVLADFER